MLKQYFKSVQGKQWKPFYCYLWASKYPTDTLAVFSEA